MAHQKKTSKQDISDPRKSPDWKPNPTGKGGFQERPQDRASGHWKPEHTISFQYKRFLKMSTDELKQWAKDTPDSERTVAMDIAYSQVIQSRKSQNHAKEITDRTEGKAQQYIDMTTQGESVNPYGALTVEELRKLAGK